MAHFIVLRKKIYCLRAETTQYVVQEVWMRLGCSKFSEIWISVGQKRLL